MKLADIEDGIRWAIKLLLRLGLYCLLVLVVWTGVTALVEKGFPPYQYTFIEISSVIVTYFAAATLLAEVILPWVFGKKSIFKR